MAYDTTTSSSNVVNKGDLEMSACQELCDQDPDNCFAYQIDLTENAVSKCSIFSETETLIGDTLDTATCYLYRKTEAEVEAQEAAELLVKTEKSTKVHHFMTSWTARMGHLQNVMTAFEDDSKLKITKCISTKEKPTNAVSAKSTYQEYYNVLQGV